MTRNSSVPIRLNAVAALTLVGGAAALIVTLRGATRGESSFNNFDIFRYAFDHLIHHWPLYEFDKPHHIDRFKYSPAFALAMAPFWYLPKGLGVVAWNVINAVLPCVALSRLRLSHGAKAFVVAFALPEIVTSAQNAQSNGLVLAAMIAAVTAFEARRPARGAIWIALGCAIKPFVALAGLYVVFAKRRSCFITALIGSSVALAALPLVAGRFELLVDYRAWLHVMSHDRVHGANYSVMTLVSVWLTAPVVGQMLFLFGAIGMLLPLVRRSRWGDERYRLRYFASLLIWVVVFNYKAESPTYVICAFGAGLWAVVARRSRVGDLLLVLFFVFTELATTDLCPPEVRHAWIQPYRLKALPAALLWGYLTMPLLFGKRPIAAAPGRVHVGEDRVAPSPSRLAAQTTVPHARRA